MSWIYQTVKRHPISSLGISVIAAVAITLALQSAALLNSAQAASGMEIAIQDDVAFLEASGSTQEKAFEAARGLNVSRIRVNAVWHRIPGAQQFRKSPPKHVDYNWRAYDRLIKMADRYGMKVQITLMGPAPAWATARRQVTNNRPNPRAFREFARSAARHFKGRVDRYSIWNEPNHTGGLTPLYESPKIYRALYQAAYGTIKGTDSKAKVLIGETAPYALKTKKSRAIAPLEFLRGLACVDRQYKKIGGGCTEIKSDGYAHHPYDVTSSPYRKFPGDDNVTIGTLSRMTTALNRLAAQRAINTPGGKPLDLYLTEYGFFARGPRQLPMWQRAGYLKHAFGIAARTPRVRSMLHYLLYEPSLAVSWDTSLVSRSGQKERTYFALRDWSTEAAKQGKIIEPGPRAGIEGRLRDLLDRN